MRDPCDIFTSYDGFNDRLNDRYNSALYGNRRKIAMPSELLIRPGLNDHEVVADLLAEGEASSLVPSSTRPIDRLVVDAHIATRRPQFAVAAQSAGMPFMIDPLTHFWQGAVRDTGAWTGLPYARREALDPERLAHPLTREELIAEVIDCELELGATAVVCPYVYARSPGDIWFARQLELLEGTASWLARHNLRLPLFAVLMASHQGFGPAGCWTHGIDRFATAARECGATAIAFALAPTKPTDAYKKVASTFAATARIKRVSRLPVFAWRQGIFGAGLTAAGADGYESGIATGEACDVPASLAPRSHQKARSGGGNPPGIFIELLGRSVPPNVGHALLDSSLRSRVMCDDKRCCPNGSSSTKAHPREHAVRTRARNLAMLNALPGMTWRLHRVAQDAKAGSTLAAQANQILRAAGIKQTLTTPGLDAIARVARQIMVEAQMASTA
jgi:hypothetical protein